jgi:hypothetical protein
MKEDKPSVLMNIKTFEILMRCGLVSSCSYNNLSSYSTKYLLRMRSRTLDSGDGANMSIFSKEVHQITQDIASEYYPDISLGPFKLDFVRIGEAGINLRTREDDTVVPDTKLLLKKYICVNLIERSEFLNENVSNTKLKPLTNIRVAVINSLAKKSVHVPHTDWDTIGPNMTAKKLYLTKLLSDKQLVNS